jgi:hypothetical protein
MTGHWAEPMRPCAECSVRSGDRGIGDGGCCTVPVPAGPDGDKFFPVFFPVGIKFSPSPSPNRGIPHGESGIGSPLPSLRAREGDEERREVA